MNPNPKQMTFKRLEKWAFRWEECAEADRKYFLSKIAYYLNSEHLRSRVEFFNFLRHHIWLRNGKGRTIKYLHFSERHQHIGFCMYFKNWALKASEEIGQLID
jgi:hypothetical protein